MIRKVKVELLVLTLLLAIEFAQMSAVPGERDEKPGRIEWLRGHLARGTFLGVDWHLVLDQSTGKTYRCEGQHSSKLLAALPPEEFPEDLMATVTHWEVSSLSDQGHTLFDYFNNPASVRNLADIVGSDTAQFDWAGPDGVEIEKKFRETTAKGIEAYYQMRFENEFKQWKRLLEKAEDKADIAELRRGKPTKQKLPEKRDIGTLFCDEQYRRFCLFLSRLRTVTVNQKPVKHKFVLTESGTVSVIFGDWLRDEDFAHSFWAEVITEANPDPEDISRECASSIVELRAKSGKEKRRKYQSEAGRFSKKAAKMRNPPPPRRAEGGGQSEQIM
jgi:hypothetical protein